MSEDLFIRRVYTHKGISVAVDIDLIEKKISLVEKVGGDFPRFENKNWCFADRTLEYTGSWLIILDAMKFAIAEASKVLKEAEKRNQEKFVRLLLSLNDAAKKGKA